MKASEPQRETGHYVAIGLGDDAYQAFIPHPLPPLPPLALNESDRDLLATAEQAVAKLGAAAELLPDVSLFIYAYVRKEALVSSQIEGTQSSFADLLLLESDQAPGVPVEDTREVSDYVAAVERGLELLRGGLPLSTRLIKDVHAVLLRSGRGQSKGPGELRRSQVWLGGSRPSRARFVPPPPNHVQGCMSALETFMHDEKEPALVKAALVHVQFETIHPFLDGNGRVGRLLIVLLLCAEDILSEPILYLSLFFKQNRQQYYEHLQRVRTHGDWEGWLRFFLQGVVETAEEGVDSTRRILALFDADRRKIENLGRASSTALRIHTTMQKKPIAQARQLATMLDVSFPTITSALERLSKLGIIKELTGYQRNRVFSYQRYVDLLSEGTDPLG